MENLLTTDTRLTALQKNGDRIFLFQIFRKRQSIRNRDIPSMVGHLFFNTVIHIFLKIDTFYVSVKTLKGRQGTHPCLASLTLISSLSKHLLAVLIDKCLYLILPFPNCAQDLNRTICDSFSGFLKSCLAFIRHILLQNVALNNSYCLI